MRGHYIDAGLTLRDDLPKPAHETGSREALIQVLVAGICNTDPGDVASRT
jgi:D-arabinose 1-dehydrogenase-like Zn-dependent alcohol dehydrogenase